MRWGGRVGGGFVCEGEEKKEVGGSLMTLERVRERCLVIPDMRALLPHYYCLGRGVSRKSSGVAIAFCCVD